jgi:assimilatory nitrate reductase electron transfer subunit
MMRIVVIGYGMAGARVVTELRSRRDDLDITVIGAEDLGAYNRILLSNVVAGKAAERDVMLRPVAGERVHVRTGSTALAIDRDRRVVSTSDGDEIPFDRVVLATGARAILPPIKGLVRDDGALPDRVASFRTLDDCRRILELARGSRRAVVLGGGLLGIEAARGLAARGLTVTVLHAAGHLMERQLDRGAGRVLATTLGALGVESRFDVVTTAVKVRDDGITVMFADDEPIDADLLVVACGVRPDVALAEAAGLAVERGVVVSDQMVTSDPAIFAIGDCAQHRGAVTGLVAPAWAQADVVADVLSGVRPLARYRTAPAVTRLKASGIDLAAMGDVADVPDADEITYVDSGRGTYAKLVVRDERLLGAIMLGDNPAVGTVIQLFDRDGRVPADLRSLLLGRSAPGESSTSAEPSPVLIPDAAVVCRCNTVTKGGVVAAWRAGAADVAAVAAATRATTGCGSCHGAVAGILQSLSRTEVNA